MTYGQSLAVAVGLTAIAVTLFLNSHAYLGWTFVTAALTFVGVAIWLFAQQKKPQDSLPTLDLVVRHSQRPYVMDMTRTDENGNEWLQRWFRVGVLSDKQVNVHVLLESVVPSSDFVFPAHALKVMGRPDRTEYVDVHPVPPGEEPTVFIDVFTQTIAERSGVPSDETNLLHLCYVPRLSRLLPNRRQRLGLRVEGGGATCLRHFVIDFDTNGLVTFTPN